MSDEVKVLNDGSLAADELHEAFREHEIDDTGVHSHRGPSVPEPPPSFGRASPTNSIDEYAALLKQVPGFELYTYPEESSVGHSGPDGKFSGESDKRSLLQKATTSAEGSPNEEGPGGDIEFLHVENLMALVPRSRELSDKGKQLLRRQLKVEDIGRQMAEYRRDINREVKKAGHIVEKEHLSKDAIQTEWKKSLQRLLIPLSKLDASEEELQFEQGLATLAQSELKQALTEFYAFLTAGADLSESEASEEDRVFEGLVSPGAVTPQADPLTAENDADEVRSDVNRTLGMPVDHGTRMPLASDNATVGLELAMPHGTRPPTEHAKQVVLDSVRAPRESEDIRTSRSKPQSFRRRRRKWSELAFCGEHLPAQSLEKAIEAAERSAHLLIPPSLRAIRRQDLEPELKDAEKLAIGASGGSEPPASARKSIVQKLDEIKVPSYHFRDFISLWGANMSQNSWTDFQRSVQYDKPKKGSIRRPL